LPVACCQLPVAGCFQLPVAGYQLLVSGALSSARLVKYFT
jgi:hypothetical protein